MCGPYENDPVLLSPAQKAKQERTLKRNVLKHEIRSVVEELKYIARRQRQTASDKKRYAKRLRDLTAKLKKLK